MITVCVFTISDKGYAGQRRDESGPAVEESLGTIGAEVKHREILPDEKDIIKNKLTEYAGKVDIILTTGGTGLSPRDVTPEATLEIIDKEVPGLAEAMRAEGLHKSKRAVLSRAVAGVRGETLIINLPGSPKGAKESLDAVIEALPHAVEKIKGEGGDCAA